MFCLLIVHAFAHCHLIIASFCLLPAYDVYCLTYSPPPLMIHSIIPIALSLPGRHSRPRLIILPSLPTLPRSIVLITPSPPSRRPPSHYTTIVLLPDDCHHFDDSRFSAHVTSIVIHSPMPGLDWLSLFAGLPIAYAHA